MRRNGSILVGLLWCLALLSLLVVGLLHASRSDLQLARYDTDRIQARYLALAGIERAKALLYTDARERSRSAQSHNGSLFDAPQHFRDIPLGRGTYRVIRGGRPEEAAGLIYGVSDEESRLNVNTAMPDDLSRLYGMTPDIPAAIVDWRDPDNAVTPGGAEADYYAAARPPGQPRNGSFQTVRELLMVRDMPRDLFLGGDPQLNGLGGLDEFDDPDQEGAAPAGDGARLGAGGVSGWGTLLTVHSGVRNLSSAGLERVNIQSADEAALTGVGGITPAIAKAIIAHRGNNRLGSIADLLEVGPAPPPGQEGTPGAVPGGSQPPGVPFAVGGPGGAAPGPGPGGPGGPGGRGTGGAAGPKVIDQNLLLDIADSLTADGASLQAGAINLNTASLEVLVCLPGVSRELAQAIVSFRASTGFLPNIAWLLRVPGVTTDLFRQLAPRVTVRSETFRILAEGRVRSSGVRQRIEAVVRVGLNDVELLSYREDDL